MNPLTEDEAGGILDAVAEWCDGRLVATPIAVERAYRKVEFALPEGLRPWNYERLEVQQLNKDITVEHLEFVHGFGSGAIDRITVRLGGIEQLDVDVEWHHEALIGETDERELFESWLAWFTRRHLESQS